MPILDTNPVIYEDGAMTALRNPNPSTVKIIPKGSQSAIIPNRRASALKRLSDIESELGRLTRLIVELRADVLHLTTD